MRPCEICGGTVFKDRSVLDGKLIEAWGLRGWEVEYINRQQGTHCAGCGTILRAQALAMAVKRVLGFDGLLNTLRDDVASGLTILEINTCEHITSYFQRLSGHRLMSWPEIDMQNMTLNDESFDRIVHSDTLEHVMNYPAALKECHRVLRSKGACCFTVPVVLDRLTRSRTELPPAYHGGSGREDMRVWTEFGVDVWALVMAAGFERVEVVCFEWPAALSIVGWKG